MQPTNRRQPAINTRRAWILATIEQYEARLLRYALRFVPDEHAARDVVQFTFLKLCDQTEQRIGDRIQPWLYTVCRNRARELSRQERRMEPLATLTETNEPSHEPNPQESAEQHDTVDCIRQAMQALPAEQQEAIDLWSEGLSYREISQVVGRGESHVRVQVHRAIKRLRQHPRIKTMLHEAAQPTS